MSIYNNHNSFRPVIIFHKHGKIFVHSVQRLSAFVHFEVAAVLLLYTPL